MIAALNGDLKNAIIASTPGGIERQEAEGQADMVANSRLPKEVNHIKITAEEAYEKMNIKVIGSHDDLFFNVKLPSGWVLESTDHDMWSQLKDDKERIRASVFYKAAFYDRSAGTNLETRFKYDVKSESRISQYSAKNKSEFLKILTGSWLGVVYDSQKEMFTTKPISVLEDSDNQDEIIEQLIKCNQDELNKQSGKYHDKQGKIKKQLGEQCQTYLQDNFPDWENVFAYWDEK